jgi:hypothetical protein
VLRTWEEDDFKKILRILIFAKVGILIKKIWVNRRFSHDVKSTTPPYYDRYYLLNEIKYGFVL